jgi:hypothetical protein
MTSVKRVESKVYRLEGFEVRIRHSNGRDVRADKGRMPTYPYERKAKDSMTVKQWIAQRFGRHYAGYRVEVLAWYRKPQRGNTKLGKVRESFFE